MLNCQQLVELVSDYVEDNLSTWDRVRFQFHLGTCAHCRRYVRQMKTTIQVTGKLTVESLPATARDELLARFRSW